MQSPRQTAFSPGCVDGREHPNVATIFVLALSDWIFWASTTRGLSDTVNRRFSYILAKKGFDGALKRVTRDITSMLRRAVARVDCVSTPTLSSSRSAALGRREYLLGEPVQIGEHERLA